MSSKNAVIPPGFKITRCPPATREALPLRTLRNQEEKALELGYESRVEMLKNRSTYQAEQRMSRYQEVFAAARAAGASVSQAIEQANASLRKEWR